MRGFKRSSIHRGLGVLIPFIFFMLLLAGCGPSQQDTMAKDQLERARSAYAQAKSDRNVEAFAPVPLADAGKALQAAEQAKSPEDKAQLAYIAEKRAQIATASAEVKMAEKEAEKLAREKSDMIAEKRTQEARIAMKEADQAKAMAAAEAQKAARAQAEAEQARAAAAAETERAARAKADAEQAKADADKLTRELSDLKAKQTERGMVLTLGEVLFALGKSDLTAKAVQSVDKLAEFLLKYTNRNVLIEGHTDSTGSDQLNMTLSQNRADAVKAALTAKGVPEGRITTKGYGKKYPMASNDTPSGRSQNRRVEVLILNEGVKPETQFRE